MRHPLIFVATLFALSVAALANSHLKILQSNNDGIIAEIELTEFTFDTVFISGRRYLSLRPEGFHLESEAMGGPAGASSKFALYLPSAKGVSLRLLEVRDSLLTGIQIAPPACDCDEPGILIDPFAYSVGQWMFQEPLILEEVFKWRRIHAAGFSFNLYSYKPAGDSLKVRKYLRFAVDFEGQFGRPSIEPWLEETYLLHFPNLERHEYELPSEVESYQVLYVYADHAGNYYKNCAKRLAELRFRQGWRVHIANARDVYDAYRPLFPAESETTWLRRFVSDSFETYGDLSFVGFVGPDCHNLDSLPGVRLSAVSHPPVTESTYSLPVWLPRLGVGRIWAVKGYGAFGTEGFVDRIIQNETEYQSGGHWDDFMFVSQTTDRIFGYIDALSQEPIVRGAGYELTHYTCHDTFMGMTPPGTQVGFNSDIVSALQFDKFAAAWHFGHGGWGAWYKSGGACCGTDEGALSAFHLYFKNIGYPTAVISGGCQTAREFGYEFTGRGALLYYGGITDGGDPKDFAQRLRNYRKLAGEAWRNYLIWAPRLIGDPLSRFYGPNEPSRFIVATSPDCAYYYGSGEGIIVSLSAEGPASWLHEAKVCLTAGFIDNAEPLCKTVPYAQSQVSFSAEEIASIISLEAGGESSMEITCSKIDFITKTIQMPLLPMPEEETIVEYSLSAGWNLISIPLNICHATMAEILPTASAIKRWDAVSRELVDASTHTLDPASAYWVMFANPPSNFTLQAPEVEGWEMDIVGGWNAFGSTENSETWAGSHEVMPSSANSPIDFVLSFDPEFGYYRAVTEIESGQGYLGFFQGSGVLMFGEIESPKNTCDGEISIIDHFRTLPNPPGAAGSPILNTAKMAASIDWGTRILQLQDAFSGTPVSNALIVTQAGDSTQIIYDEISPGSGQYSLPSIIDAGGYYRILAKHPGYIDQQTLGGLEGGATLWGLVELTGSINLTAGDTLRIEAGTVIRIADCDSCMSIKITASGNGACIIVDGTAENQVYIGSSVAAIGWGGILVENGGNVELRWANIERANRIGIQTPELSEITTRFIGTNFFDCGSVVLRGDMLHLIIDTCAFECYVEIEAVDADFSECSFASSNCINMLSGEFTLDNCRFEDFDSNACSISEASEVNFERCYFYGRGNAVRNLGEARFASCHFTSDSGDYILTDGEEAITSAEFCIFEGWRSACIYSFGRVEFGSGGFGHNCFITGDAEWTFDGEGGDIYAHFCYFDTLKFTGRVKVEADFRDLDCIPDTGLSVVICEDGNRCIPGEFFLDSPVPNPFNASVSVEFDVAAEARIEIGIFNMNGRQVAVILEKYLKAGTYRAVWDGRSESGDFLPSGVYLCRMFVKAENGGRFVEGTRKMTLIK